MQHTHCIEQGLMLHYRYIIAKLSTITRDQYQEIENHLQKKEITILVGPRQVGKTTLLHQLKAGLIGRGVAERKILMLNMDVEADRKYLESQTLFVEYLKSRIEKESAFPALYVVVDEAQRVSDAGRFFKGVYDLNLNIKLILTGSSALDIKANIHEALTGRKRMFEIMPFSFREYLLAQSKVETQLLELEPSPELQKTALLPLYEKYMVTGGYPKAVLSETEEERNHVLSELYESYLLKDVIGLLRIENPAGFTSLLKILASQTGGLFNTQEVSRTLGISRETVNKYLYLMEQTFIIFSVPPFFTNSRKEMKKMKKYYFIDTGIRNYLVGNTEPWKLRNDTGAVLENAVALELKRNLNSPAELKFWRTKSKAEVDFIVDQGGDKWPFEVKQQVKSSRALKEFMLAYGDSKGWMVNLERESASETPSLIYPWNIRKCK